MSYKGRENVKVVHGLIERISKYRKEMFSEGEDCSGQVPRNTISALPLYGILQKCAGRS